MPVNIKVEVRIDYERAAFYHFSRGLVEYKQDLRIRRSSFSKPGADRGQPQFSSLGGKPGVVGLLAIASKKLAKTGA
jgi:hypothetical protein